MTITGTFSDGSTRTVTDETPAPGSVATYAAECDQEAALSEPRDHTDDLLFARYKAAENLHRCTLQYVEQAERGLEIAKLGEERARENAQAAANELRAHNAALYERAQWLIKGITPVV